MGKSIQQTFNAGSSFAGKLKKVLAANADAYAEEVENTAADNAESTVKIFKFSLQKASKADE